MNRVFPLFIFTVMLMVLLARSSAAADENRVALVVDFGNGEVATHCVSFPEQTITGFEALGRSGLAVETDFQTGGAAVCSIDDHGCPSDDCFCSCSGGDDCVYWSYWHQSDGRWNYSVAGSGLYQVRDGAIDGWVWGFGSVTQASPPPLIFFDEICAGSQLVASTIGDVPASSENSPPTDNAGWTGYAGFFGLVLLLGALLLIVGRRRSNATRETGR